MATKTLFDGVETELKNARIAISNADRYLDAIKEVVEVMSAKVKIVEEVEIVQISTKKLEKDMEDYLKPSA